MTRSTICAAVSALRPQAGAAFESALLKARISRRGGFVDPPPRAAGHQQSRDQPVFAAVHDLLLRGVEHPLRLFYPDLTPDPLPDEDAFPAFCSFCNAHEEDIRELLITGACKPTRSAAACISRRDWRQSRARQVRIR